VVPPIQQALEWMCERYFGVNPLTVEPGVTADLPLNVDTPREVGADRVVSCVAALALYGAPLIVVDFGTATRFDCVNRRGEFIGGAIAPGINTAAEALVSRAARLFRGAGAAQGTHRPQHDHEHPVRHDLQVGRTGDASWSGCAGR
jgi:type III pantothenate kinase